MLAWTLCITWAAQSFSIDGSVVPILTGAGVCRTSTVAPNTLSALILASMLAVSCIEGVVHLLALSEVVEVMIWLIAIIVAILAEREPLHLIPATN